ncbi:MAG: class I SAM-dependent methyltransferase [Bacteroidetes bacterium]|nr:class I SAM-dependent methyltransferase [Bacteroidota bacterium]
MAKMISTEKLFVNSRLQYYFHKWFGFGPFLEKLPASTYKSILEIGSGVGFTTRMIRVKYPVANIVATDFDEDSIRIAQKNNRLHSTTFMQADATKLPFSDNEFDAAFSVLTLHHIDQFEKAISELVRVVKSGGDIYIMDLSARLNFRKELTPGVFMKTDLLQIGEKYGLKMKDKGGMYLFSVQGSKL